MLGRGLAALRGALARQLVAKSELSLALLLLALLLVLLELELELELELQPRGLGR